jgi:UDP-N-acetylglucosamine 4,6-dehydratase/5-epimerase
MSANEFYKDKTILVTGGAGSIGSEVVRSLIPLKPKAIRVFDNNESGLFELEQELECVKLRSFIGDIRDKERVARAMENVDIVFHGAALKHVPLCEFNPFDAIKTNVLGTQNLLDVALNEEVEKVLFISTDKAVNPTNVMGTTKLLGERLTISANHYKGTRKTIFSCVRFGNVLGSHGSVVPVFIRQIKEGKPLTITNPEMTRFIMSISRSVELILKAGVLAQGGEIFILKMPVLKINDLADVIIDTFAPKLGKKPTSVKKKIIGKRFGEKFYEELMYAHEAENAYENSSMFIIKPQTFDFGPKTTISLSKDFKKVKITEYTSKNQQPLTKDEIKILINSIIL